MSHINHMEETLTKELNSGTSACQWHGRADGDAHSHTQGGACFTMGYFAPDVPSLTHRFQPSPCSTHCVGSTMVYAAMGLRHKPALVFSRVKPMVLFALRVIWKRRQVTDPPTRDRFPPFQHQLQTTDACRCLSPQNRARDL